MMGVARSGGKWKGLTPRVKIAIWMKGKQDPTKGGYRTVYRACERVCVCACVRAVYVV